MIGGGPGSFIGAIHRIAANMDGLYQLVCGAFSSSPEKSVITGAETGIEPSRVYDSYEKMILAEKSLPEEERMQVVVIVTPNHVHYHPAKLALENGFHVIIDKPITLSSADAVTLRNTVEQTGLLLCLTHTYTGYPMVKEARQIINSGRLGKVRKVYVEYPQGWLSELIEAGNQKQATWRTDPQRSGVAGCIGDIGTHAFNLAEYVTGLKVSKICADINIVVEGRKLDDDGVVLLKFNNGAGGVLLATQIATGEENNIKIRVYGEKGSLEWQQKDNNSLIIKWPDKPSETLRAGTSYLSEIASFNCRTPAGHPEGYLEAFANHYRNFAVHIKHLISGEPKPGFIEYPTADDGIRGMLFIEKVIESGNSDKKWIDLNDYENN